jgi:hypothetical protein
LFDLPSDLSSLVQYDAGNLMLTARESKHREFKLAFVQNDFSDYTKTLAAFGNASGGYKRRLIYFFPPRLVRGVVAIEDDEGGGKSKKEMSRG